MHRILYKLFHVEESIEQNMREIDAKNKDLAGLRKQHQAFEKALAAARAEQAKSRTAVSQKERTIKKAEKSLEAKVRCAHFLAC